MKISKRSHFWFRSDYDFIHASGEVENLNNKVFKVTKIHNRFIYCKDRKGIEYMFDPSIKNHIATLQDA